MLSLGTTMLESATSALMVARENKRQRDNAIAKAQTVKNAIASEIFAACPKIDRVGFSTRADDPALDFAVMVRSQHNVATIRVVGKRWFAIDRRATWSNARQRNTWRIPGWRNTLVKLDSIL